MKEAIFDSFPELEKYDISYDRIGYRYKGKVLACQISKTTGNGYINGRYLEDSGRQDARDWIKIKDYAEGELRLLIAEAMGSFNENINQ